MAKYYKPTPMVLASATHVHFNSQYRMIQGRCGIVIVIWNFLVLHTFAAIPVSKADQQLIVDAHNAFRRRSAPNAANMMKMYWDESLAEQATKHAMRYTNQHDQHYERYAADLPGVATGQNMCFGASFRTWTDCLNIWFLEGSKFQHGSGSTTGSPWDVVHVTQVLYWKAIRIGCALTTCECSSYYVCNYGYSLNWEDFNTPWTEGQKCGACPDHCDNGLCDCNNKMCMNDGTIDLATCQCTCVNNPKSPFSGDQCEILNCGVPIFSGCKYFDASYAPKYCQDYTNLMNVCPHYCNRCQ